ncbi:hypothetical protein OIU77_003843, partial [Salix suchowensis]
MFSVLGWDELCVSFSLCSGFVVEVFNQSSTGQCSQGESLCMK